MSVRSEIETRLNTLGLPVAYENATFTKPTNAPWLSVKILDRVRQNKNVGADGYREYGSFFIHVYAPIGKGMKQAETIVDSVINLFPVIPKTGGLSFEKPLNSSTALVEEGYICVPLTGTYRLEI